MSDNRMSPDTIDVAGDSTIDLLAIMFGVYNLTNRTSPYALFFGEYNASVIKLLEDEGFFKILETEQKLKGKCLTFELTELGKEVLNFDQL